MSRLRSMSIEEINILPPDEILRERNLALKEQRNYFIFPHRLADGKVRTVEVHSTPIGQKGKNILFSIIHDITERKHTEEALRASEQRWKFALEGARDGVWDWNAHTNEVFFSRQWKAMPVYEDHEIGNTLDEWERRVHPDDKERCYSDLERHFRGESAFYENEHRVLCKDGNYRWILDRGKVMQWTDDVKPLRVIGTHSDITERKRSEELLEESSLFLNTLLNAIPVPLFYKDTDGRYSGFNKSFEEFYGKTRQALIGKTVFDIHPEEAAQDYAAKDDELFRNPGVQVYPSTMMDKSGVVHDIIFHKSTFTDSQGQVLGLIGVILDVTERKKVERVIQQVAAYNRTLIEASIDPLVTISPDGRISDVNTATEKVTGYSHTEMIGTNFSNYFTEPEQAMAGYKQVFKDGLVKDYELEILHKDGHVTPVTYSASVYRGESGEVIGVFAAALDITDRKLLEEERLEMERKLLHAQKLESLGVMAGGIAHDFNNLMMVVLGNLEFTLSDCNLESETRRGVENAMQAAERSAELSRQMLIYSGSGLYTPKDLDLGDIANKLAHKNEDLLRSVIPQTTRLNFKINKGLPLIQGDEDQIQRVITNLIINASEAIGAADGDVTIRTGVVDCDESYLSCSRLEDKPDFGRFVFLEVTDTGCGMDAETQHKLFDPFFTTKFWGRGLGMAEVMGTVKGHHGAIIVESELGKGTTIRVLLPLPKKVQAQSVQDMDIVEIQTQPSDVLSRRKTILVVDDEELVRGLVLKRLEVLGYDTIAASDGEEGVRVFLDRSNEIDMVILDFVMPRMNGVEAFGEMIRIKQDVKVILSSGYTEDVVAKRFPGPKPAGFLNKPYKLKFLRLNWIDC